MKKKWVPVAILAGIEIALFAFLYCKGFRITYAPDLENSWTAVSAFAAWGGVIMSFVAIMVAIQIPKKIADRQDKIALFEKKFEIYDFLLWCCAVAKFTKQTGENGDILQDLYFAFSKNAEIYQRLDRSEAMLYIIKNCTKLKNADFFFSKDISAYIIDVSEKIYNLSLSDASSDDPGEYNKKKQAFIEAAENFEKNEVLRKMEEEIKII